MDNNSNEYSPISDFTENCAVAIGQVVRLLIEGLRDIFADKQHIYDSVNFEYITLIESDYSQLVEEIKNGVQLYVDCNSESFQTFSTQDLNVALLKYNDKIQHAQEILKSTEKELKYVDRIKKLKLESDSSEKIKATVADDLSGEELNIIDTAYQLPQPDNLVSRDELEETPNDLPILDETEVAFNASQNDLGVSVKTEPTQDAISGIEGDEEGIPHDEIMASEAVVNSARIEEGDENDFIPPDTNGAVCDEVKGVHPCAKCNRKFNSSKNLQVHMATHNQLHKAPVKKRRTNFKFADHFTCSHCNKRFRSRARYDNHVAMHTKPYICPTCGVGFGKEQVLRAHRNIHSGEAPFECAICHKGYRERYLLADHMRYHKTKVTCPHCSVTFSKKSNLYRHIEIKHEGMQNSSEKKHFCSVCDTGFSYLESYENHMRKNHPGSIESHRPKFKCNNCGVRFKSQESRESHKLKCVEQTFTCDICFKVFGNKILLHNHKRYHTNKNLYCPHCGKRFVKSYDLKSHVMRRHENERPFKCEYCFKGFVTNHELKKHVVTHTGVSQFQCHLCQKYFICNQVLQRHVTEVHMRIAKFVCDLCGDKFRDARTLRNHISRHDDNKPFKCPTCNKGFSWTAGLKRHIENVHENKSSPQFRKARKTPKADIQAGSEVLPVLTSSNNQLIIYQPGVKTGLSAHEVTAAESVEVQSVVYLTEQPGNEALGLDDVKATFNTNETLIYGTSSATENGVIYCHNAPSQAGAEVGDGGGEGEIQLVMYTA